MKQRISRKIKKLRKWLETFKISWYTATSYAYMLGYDIDSVPMLSARKVTAAHEAGHWLMAELLGIPVHAVNIFVYGGMTTLSKCRIDMSDRTMVSNHVKIYYAGLAGEQILIGETGNGCMGGKDSDLESAQELIKRHILFTGEAELTPDYISQETADKIIAMSKQIHQEVVTELTEHKDKLEEKYIHLLKKRDIYMGINEQGEPVEL